jgi:hypothetical protein
LSMTAKSDASMGRRFQFGEDAIGREELDLS